MVSTPNNWAILKLYAHLLQCHGVRGGKNQQSGKRQKWNDNGVMFTLEYDDKGGYTRSVH